MGKNVGSNPPIYCVVVYFPETGECRFYDMNRVTRVDEPDAASDHAE